MSKALPLRGQNTGLGEPAAEPPRQLHSDHNSQPQSRLLACALCQQRKVKCDRRLPCSSCIKHQLPCSPITQPRQRRARFPERALLDRIRRYEDLLRQHNIEFDPIHKDTGPSTSQKASPDSRSYYESSKQEVSSTGDEPSPSTPGVTIPGKKKNIWEAMTRDLQEHADASGDGRIGWHPLSRVYDETYDSNDYLLLGLRDAPVDLFSIHPEPVHVFQLWQIYLDNVNPFLKVTHTPTLQSRIIEATSNMAYVSPALEALLFSIYCVAIHSLTEDDCQAKFGTTKSDLLERYRFGCHQALMNGEFLRTANRDFLTAYYLYLISVPPETDIRSLSSMLGIAIRIAQRMGINDEGALSKHSILEAEMRRRLWWSLVVFDNRVTVRAEQVHTELLPTWDCKIPLNINDSDLCHEMKEPPANQTNPAESIYVVVRSELAEYTRNSKTNLEYINPNFIYMAKELPDGGSAASLSKRINEKYIERCDPQIPLHFITIWSARFLIARERLLEYMSVFWNSPKAPTEEERDEAFTHALHILEGDTKTSLASQAQKYQWMLQLYFPMPGYIHIASELKARPLTPRADEAWEVMAQNCDARFAKVKVPASGLYMRFASVILQAWEACQRAWEEAKPGSTVTEPRIITRIKQVLSATALGATTMERDTCDTQELDDIFDTSMWDFSTAALGAFGNVNMGYVSNVPGSLFPANLGVAPEINGLVEELRPVNPSSASPPTQWALGDSDGDVVGQVLPPSS